MPMEHSMEARALKTGYDNRVIIDDVNVEIPMGKVSVILGSNGCGKSTLLKTVSYTHLTLPTIRLV